MNTVYRYEAWSRDGKVERSTIGAVDRRDAYRNLRERGYRPISLIERGAIFKVSKWFGGRPMERLAFFRSFAALAAAGTSLDECFELLVQQARVTNARGIKHHLPWVRAQREQMLRAIEGIGREVLTGTKLHDAMARRPEQFSEVESAMCQIGDEAGTLPRVLAQVADFLERERRFSKQIGDALFYPAMVALFAAGMIVYIFAKLVPQFSMLFQGYGVNPPLSMQIMLHVSTIVTSPIFVVLLSLGIVAGAIAFARALETPQGAMAFDVARLRIPFLGDLIEKVIVGRLARLLAMLFDAGKSPMRAIEVCIPVSESPVFGRALTQVRDALAKGQAASVYEAMVRTGAFEPVLTGFVKVGVRTGDLPSMFIKVAEYYEDDVASLTAMIPTVVQTLVTMLMGVVVGLIVYSVYVPLSQLVSQIHQ